MVDMATRKDTQKQFNDEMVKETWVYQKKYGFEINPRKQHEFWNVEADAFKHAFGGAIMSFRYGNWGSTLGGIYLENQTKNNPSDEWNMDSWNNDQGRKIAKEIIKEYGQDFYDKNPEKCEHIIAEKIMSKMRNGELITHPSDKRKYKGPLEITAKITKDYQDKQDSKRRAIGGATPVSNSNSSVVYKSTKPEISKPASQKFSDKIRENYRSKQNSSNESFSKIFKSFSSTQDRGKGHWVTMNGAHVFIEK